ncbi:ABC transporter permease [Pseudonocardia sp. MH-G8]|uniref:ABC transporter permease n=1 Tax=Pseudonocardia sp. MH-G8 TaxID=1854588 RepID=UPI00130461D6|nr:ABC transporter permease [Pseudonocardia sp. MH-G8]
MGAARPAPEPVPPGEDATGARGPSGRRRQRKNWMALFHNVWPVLVVALAWQLFAMSDIVPRILTPTLGDIAGAILRLENQGTLWAHVGTTLARMFGGFAIAAVVGSALGMSMAYWKWSERFFAPILSLLMPIPSLAWVPLFILWFGLGNLPTVMLVAFVSAMPIASNVWMGVRSANPIWLRAATSMNARGLFLFWKVISPAAMPSVLSGLRIGLAQAWRAVVAGEFVANTQLGLGWLIFNSIAFLQSDIMFAGIFIIGLIGFLMERVLIQRVERYTVVRWGMVQEAGGQ